MLGASQYDPKVLTLSRAPTQGSGHSFLQGVSAPFVILVFQTHYDSKTNDTWYNHTGRLLGLVFLLDLDVATRLSVLTDGREFIQVCSQ